VKERSEEREEKHNFGKNEKQHTSAQPVLYLGGVKTLARFLNNGNKPAHRS